MKSFLEHRAGPHIDLLKRMNQPGKKSKEQKLRMEAGALTLRAAEAAPVNFDHESEIIRHPQHGIGSVPIPLNMMSTPVISVLDDDERDKAAAARIPLRVELRKLIKLKNQKRNNLNTLKDNK